MSLKSAEWPGRLESYAWPLGSSHSWSMPTTHQCPKSRAGPEAGRRGVRRCLARRVRTTSANSKKNDRALHRPRTAFRRRHPRTHHSVRGMKVQRWEEPDGQWQRLCLCRTMPASSWNRSARTARFPPHRQLAANRRAAAQAPCHTSRSSENSPNYLHRILDKSKSLSRYSELAV